MSARTMARSGSWQAAIGAALVGLVLTATAPIAGATGDPALDQLVATPAEASWTPAPDAQISAAIDQVKKVESDLVGPSVVVQAGGRIWQDAAGRRLVVLIIGFDPSPNLQGAAQSEVVNSCLSATGAQPTATVPFAPIPGAYVATSAGSGASGPTEIASFGWVSHNLLVSVIVTTPTPADRAAAEAFATSQAKALPDRNLTLTAAGSSTTTTTTAAPTTTTTAAPAASKGDGGGASPLLLGLGAVVVLAAIGGAVVLVRRHGGGPDGPPSAGGPPVEPTTLD
jgi:hypothetical protein